MKLHRELVLETEVDNFYPEWRISDVLILTQALCLEDKRHRISEIVLILEAVSNICLGSSAESNAKGSSSGEHKCAL